MSDKTKRVSIDVEVNIKEANKALDDFSKRITKMTKNGINISFNINKGEYTKDLNHISSTITNMVSKINKDLSNIRFHVNTNSAEADINRFTANLTGAYGRIERTSTHTANSMRRNYSSVFSSIVNMANNMSSSFNNSFQGISNTVNNIKNIFTNGLDGTAIGNRFMGDFINSVKSRMGSLKSSMSNVGKLVELGRTGTQIGKLFGNNFVQSALSSMKQIARAANSIIKDAMKNDYGSKLKSQGLRGKLTNAKIDATLPKELGAVVKKLSSSLLEARDDIRNFAKVCRQASDLINEGTIGKKVNRTADKLSESSNPYRSLMGSVLKDLKAEMQYVVDGLRMLGKVLDPIAKTFASIAKPILAASGAFTQSLTVVRRTFESNIVNPISKFGTKISEAVDSASSKLTSTINKFADKMSEAADKINTDMDDDAGEGGGFFGKFQDSEGDFSWDKTLDSLDDVYKRLRDVYKQANETGKPLRTLANMGFDKASNALSRSAIKSMREYRDATTGTQKALAGLKASASIAGLGLAKGLQKGIAGISAVTKAITGIAKNTAKFVKAGMAIGRSIVRGIMMPFRAIGSFINLGRTIVGSISRGIRGSVSLVSNSIKFLTKGIVAPVKLLARTISNTISASLSLAKGTLSGLNRAIIDALGSDGVIELEIKPSGSNNLFGELFNKRDVTNQLKKDLSLITATMPKELGQVTQVFGSKMIDAGNMVKRYANFMVQAYDFVKNNKGVIISTFNRLYSVAAPVVKRVLDSLGTLLKAAASRIMSTLSNHLIQKLSPVAQELIKTVIKIKDGLLQLLDPSTDVGNRFRELLPHIVNFAKKVGEVIKTLIDFAKHVADAIKKIADFIASIGRFVIELPKKITEGIKSAIEAIKNTLVKGFEKIIDVLAGIINKLLHPIKTIQNAGSNLSNWFNKKMRGDKGSNMSADTTRNHAGTVYGLDQYDYSSLGKNKVTEDIGGSTAQQQNSSLIVDSHNNPISNSDIQDTTKEVEKLKESLQDVVQISDNVFVGISDAEEAKLARTSKQLAEFNRLLKEAINDVDGAPLTDLGDILDKVTSETDELKQSLQDVVQVSDNVFVGISEEESDKLSRSADEVKRMEEFTRLLGDAIKEVDMSQIAGAGTILGSTTDNIAQGARRVAENVRQAFDGMGNNQSVQQATESLKQTGIQAKNLVKNIAEAKLAAQKVDEAFHNMRHPIEALRANMQAKLGKFHIKLTLQGEKEALKAASNVANAMNKFKSAKGAEKLSAGFDVAVQSIKYKLNNLKNTLKSNFVENLINKMTPKAKKASKELAENIPGGAKTIGFFKGALGKLSLLLGGIGIANYIKQATTLAIQYEASAMQIQRSLGSASQAIMDFAENSAAALGIGKTDAMKYGNTFSLMVRQFETDTEKIADTTNALMQAAAITASATGTELSTVMDSFRSALTGSSESVDQYGLSYLALYNRNII